VRRTAVCGANRYACAAAAAAGVLCPFGAEHVRRTATAEKPARCHQTRPASI